MSRKQVINFLLPFAGNKPIGGFKIAYEYANRLAGRGHTVNLIHPSYTFKDTFLNNLKYKLSYIIRKISKSYRPDSWFKLDSRVNVLWIPSIKDEHIPGADVLIATAWRTAACGVSLSESKGKKFYFIQHFETWNGPEDEVIATWKMPFKKIVIAKWLKEIADSYNEESIYVPNAFDFSEFGMDTPPEKRDPYTVMMLYNDLKFKGSKFGIEAFKKVKEKAPALKVILFGVPERPEGLPEWFEYNQTPERKHLRALYNTAAVFISPSFAEGFPLPPAEAMVCGAALAASDIGGHREYAIDNDTAVMFEAGNADSIAEAVLKLLNDNDMRLKIAYRGNEYIKQFTWERAVKEFEEAIGV
jgi:glycosyltransferase involved in cell wall biosynthesis